METLEERLNPSPFYGFAIGGDSSGSSDSLATTTDSADNVYVTGYFRGTIHFGTEALTAQGIQDAFVAKYSLSGSLDWVADLGGAGGSTSGNAIAVDASGNVYTTGSFDGTVNFDPNSGSHTLSSSGGSENAYVSKLNASGQYVFAVDLGAGGTAEGYGIGLDGSGDIYTTGTFSGADVNLDPNSINHQLSSSHAGADNNAYVSELNSTGQYIFAVDLGYGGNANARGIAVVGSLIYTTGFFSGTNLNFDPNDTVRSAMLSSSHGGSDENAYIAELNYMPDQGPAYILGYGGNAVGSSIVVDSANNIYVTGSFTGVDLSFYGNQLSSSDNGVDSDAYVVKLPGPYKTTSFAVAFGAGGTAYGQSITVDSAGDVYTTGYFEGTNVNFDQTNSNHELTSSPPGANNAYISELNSSGVYLFTSNLGYGGTASGNGIVVDASYNVYTTGYFEGIDANFNPFGTEDLSSPSGQDSFFLSKLTQLQINTTSLSGGFPGETIAKTISVSYGAAPYSFSISNGALPTGLNLNLSSGEIYGTFGAYGTYTFTITVTDNADEMTSQTYTWVAAPPQFTPQSLPDGVVGTKYLEGVSVSGAPSGIYIFSISKGALPSGLSLNSDGAISGTPNEAGTFTFTISVDAAGEFASQNYAITIQLQYVSQAQGYTYAAYIYAYDAYVTGTGSYTAFFNEFYANYYAQIASSYSQSGFVGYVEYYDYYAYYYGYYGQYYAYQDYAASGGFSAYSFYAYYDGYYGQYFAYEVAIGN